MSGTGYPFLTLLTEKGYNNLFANDIAFNLLLKSKSTLKNVRYINSDIQKLPFKKKTFDLLICLHSSWYFSDVVNALENSILIADNIIIDFLNKNNFKKRIEFYINKIYLVYNAFKHIFYYPYLFLKKRFNIFKRIYYLFQSIFEYKLTDMNKIIKLLKEKNLNYRIFNPLMEEITEKQIKKYERIIIYIYNI